MPLIPGNILGQHTTTDINSGHNAGEISAHISDSGKQALLNMIDSLTTGDTILAKVTGQSGKNLTILTNQGVTINAKNSAQITFDKGSTILFEVTKSQGKDISIRPLYQNTSVQNTAEAALKQAGLPINERSLEMVGRNMEYGNPIDRNSLIEYFKDIALFPEANVKCITDLQKMNLPVTSENIRQYQAYMNMDNSIKDALSNISDSIIKDAFDNLQQELSNIGVSCDNNAPLDIRLSSFDMLSDIISSFDEFPVKTNLSVSTEELMNLLNQAKENGLNLEQSLSLLNEDIDKYSPLETMKAIISDLSVIKYDENSLSSSEENSSEVNTFSFDVNEYGEGISKLINSDLFKNVFRKVFDSRYTASSDELGDKTQINNLYQRMYSETKEILEILNRTSQSDSDTGKYVSNLKENIEFMNDLNSYVPYIQIPFHSDDNSNNSELYVFRNKRNLSQDNSEITAFIHLDMTYLGPTDVMVRLNKGKVTTNFTVKDDDTLTFIENHIDLLNRRINQKGYSFEASVDVKKADQSPMQIMLNNNEQHLNIMMTSFDARV